MPAFREASVPCIGHVHIIISFMSTKNLVTLVLVIITNILSQFGEGDLERPYVVVGYEVHGFRAGGTLPQLRRRRAPLPLHFEDTSSAANEKPGAVLWNKNAR